MQYKAKHDLQERTAKFGEAVIIFCKTLERNVISLPLISQIVRSATSIGANYGSKFRKFQKRFYKQDFYLQKGGRGNKTLAQDVVKLFSR